MKSFKLDENGDVVINEMVAGADNLAQSVWVVLGVQEGEWMFNQSLGINLDVLLSKNPNEDEVRSEIQKGLLDIDSTFQIESFEMAKTNRKLRINFTATNVDGKKVEVVKEVA